MAEDNKPQHRDAPAERTESRTAVADHVVEQASQSRDSSTGAQTRTESVNQMARGLDAADARREGNTITVAMGNPFAGIRSDGIALSAPPDGKGQVGDAGPQPGDGKAKPAVDAQGLMKTDGKVDMPPKPDKMSDADYQRMQKAVESFNKNLQDPKNGLTDQQKQDLERSAEQMLSNKNPDGSDRRPPLDPAEGTKVLEQANRMFDSREQITQNFGKNPNGTDRLDASQQNKIIDAMVHDVANPNNANQGQNNTCNVTAAAKSEMMQHPGAQAERFVNMYTSTDGYVNFPNGKGGQERVQIDRNSLLPDRETDLAAANPGSGARDAYMQGLNHLYVNAVTQQRGEYYTDGRGEFKGDTGERLHKGSFSGEVVKKPDGRVENSPAFGVEDVQRVMNMTGAGTVAADFDRFGVRAGSGVNNVNAADAASLDKAWEKNGGKPMVIAVDTNSQMFQPKDQVGGVSPGGGHVVTLADRRENPPGSGKFEYMLQNSWGDKYNGWVSGDAIASAMNPSKGDRSGNIPGADGGQHSGNNWGEQTYHSPEGGQKGRNYQTQGDGSGYGEGNQPERDPSGIKSGQDLQNEMDRRQKEMQDEQKRLEDEARKRKLNDDEQQLLQNLKKLQKEEKDRQEEEEKRKQQLRQSTERPNGGDGGDPQK